MLQKTIRLKSASQYKRRRRRRKQKYIIHNFASVALVTMHSLAILFQRTKCRIRAFSRADAVLGNVRRLSLCFSVSFFRTMHITTNTNAELSVAVLVCSCFSFYCSVRWVFFPSSSELLSFFNEPLAQSKFRVYYTLYCTRFVPTLATVVETMR